MRRPRPPELLRERFAVFDGTAWAGLKLAFVALLLAWLLGVARRRPAASLLGGVLGLAAVERGLQRGLVPHDGALTPAQLDSLARAGDVLLCRSYRSKDAVELLAFRWLAGLAAHREFHTHAGIVVERGGRKYVLDSVWEPSLSSLTGARKETGVTMRPLAAWAESYSGRVRLYACERLRAAVDPQRLLAYADSVRHEPFTYGLGGMSCVDTVQGALADQGLFARPPAWRVLTPGHLADAGLYAVPGGVRFAKYVVDNAWRRRHEK